MKNQPIRLLKAKFRSKGNKGVRLLILLLVGFSQLLYQCTPVEMEPRLEMLSVPSEEGAASNLFQTYDGQLYLSWIEYINDTTDALYVSHLEMGSWQKPIEVSRGSDWFVNWADFPSVAVFPNNNQVLAAHWLQKSAGGTYDYDVKISISKDKGQHWSSSFIPHRDSIPAEHGFVTLTPTKADRLLAVWLDGRNTKKKDPTQNGMTLRTAEFDDQGQLSEEVELDHRICDCCQTDAAWTNEGPVVVYRDRSHQEIRDISLVRRVNGVWTEPRTVHDDHWKIAGCPVNGPAIAAKEDFVAVAWYTGSQEINKVRVAFSEDSGATFGTPIRVDRGDPIGRVDVVIEESGQVLVSWIEKKAEKAFIQLSS